MGNVGPAQALRQRSRRRGPTVASFCQIALTFSVTCRRKVSTSSSRRRPTTWASGTTSTRTRCRQADYLEWTHTWVAAAARVLRPDGSLFLNVGAKPSDPLTALDVAQAARSHLRLQNIIHWIKSIAIERELAGANAGPRARPGRRALQADQQRSLPERLPRVRLPLHARRRDAARSARARRPLPGSVEHRAVARRGRRRPLPRQHVVHPVRDDSAARSRPAAPGDVPVTAARTVSAPARAVAHRAGDGSVRGARQHGRRLRPARRELHRVGHRRNLPVARRSRARARPSSSGPSADKRPARAIRGRRGELKPRKATAS